MVDESGNHSKVLGNSLRLKAIRFEEMEENLGLASRTSCFIPEEIANDEDLSFLLYDNSIGGALIDEIRDLVLVIKFLDRILPQSVGLGSVLSVFIEPIN